MSIFSCRSLAAIALALTGAGAHAATVMELKLPGQSAATMSVAGQQARLDMETGRYLLIDAARGRYYAVDENAQIILDMAWVPEQAPDLPRETRRRQTVQPELREMGPGPEIAGYPTRHYRLLANGRHCQDSYFSAEAMAEGDLVAFQLGFHQLSTRQRAGYESLGVEFEPCELADQLTGEQQARLGLKMRTEGPQGRLRQEITALQLNQNLPEGHFQVPRGYTMSNPAEQARAQRTQPGVNLDELDGGRQQRLEDARRQGREMLRR
ncbi:hypothetical protein [Alkalilimnicola sp. S0819]|uniref:hypothetical protein n=1 Tax=Alkalilimnicola sp. S0819 TaxID=2613922 RepID=UPI0012615032|nr:hypothetical protein [Alkalilimnicola sp. S0819]KAB7628382.1 hypothetical protein F3N43_01410 [Alkalilimnicola sp. S0819]MPQ15285.1 hypothetical protein [Alkalilimnicola sp. S0819]